MKLFSVEAKTTNRQFVRSILFHHNASFEGVPVWPGDWILHDCLSQWTVEWVQVGMPWLVLWHLLWILINNIFLDNGVAPVWY